MPEELRARGAVVSDAASVDADWILIQVDGPEDLPRVAEMAAALADTAGLWVIRPKGKGAPVSEAEVMAAGREAGLALVKTMRFSDTHTGEKFVVPTARRR